MTARHYVLGIGAAAAAGALAVRAARRAVERWEAHPGCCDLPMPVPDGEHSTLTTSDGGELAVTVAGSGGRHFVLSHCWGGHRGVWGHVGHHLVERGHTVVVYDQRGHGESTPGDDGFALSRLAGDLREVIDHVGAPRATVAGHSLGGMTVQAYLVHEAQHAEHVVDGAVLVATSAGGLSRGAMADRIALGAVTRDRSPAWFHSRLGGALAVRHQFGDEPWIEHILATRDMWAAVSADVKAACLRAIFDYDVSDALAEVTVPVTVVHGRRDVLLPPRNGRRIAEAIPHAQLELVDGAGHMLPLERPALIADLLEATADRRPAAA